MKKTKEEQMPLAGTEEGEILVRLHERVEKAIATIQELRRERDSLRAKLEQVSSLEEDCARFQKERSEIRNRIETMLANLESLEQV
ncbi:MAG: cell division protein ZapB [Acidobacteriota bacterium]